MSLEMICQILHSIKLLHLPLFTPPLFFHLNFPSANGMKNAQPYLQILRPPSSKLCVISVTTIRWWCHSDTTQSFFLFFRHLEIMLLLKVLGFLPIWQYWQNHKKLNIKYQKLINISMNFKLFCVKGPKLR